MFFTRIAAINSIVTGLQKPNQAYLRVYKCKAFTIIDNTY
jgi:hypothetical protein